MIGEQPLERRGERQAVVFCREMKRAGGHWRYHGLSAGIAVIISGAAAGEFCVSPTVAAIVFRASARYSGCDLAADSKIRLCAATELPAGTAPSTTSLPRANSAS